MRPLWLLAAATFALSGVLCVRPPPSYFTPHLPPAGHVSEPVCQHNVLMNQTLKLDWFEVDLDKPAEDRWTGLVKEKTDQINNIIDYFLAILPK
jgi:hypothetical protein